MEIVEDGVQNNSSIEIVTFPSTDRDRSDTMRRGELWMESNNDTIPVMADATQDGTCNVGRNAFNSCDGEYEEIIPGGVHSMPGGISSVGGNVDNRTRSEHEETMPAKFDDIKCCASYVCGNVTSSYNDVDDGIIPLRLEAMK